MFFFFFRVFVKRHTRTQLRKNVFSIFPSHMEVVNRSGLITGTADMRIDFEVV